MFDGPYARNHIAAFAAGKTVTEAVAPYFAEVLAAIRSGLFDTIGHLDQCKLWLNDWFKPADFAAVIGAANTGREYATPVPCRPSALPSWL